MIHRGQYGPDRADRGQWFIGDNMVQIGLIGKKQSLGKCPHNLHGPCIVYGYWRLRLLMATVTDGYGYWRLRLLTATVTDVYGYWRLRLLTVTVTDGYGYWRLRFGNWTCYMSWIYYIYCLSLIHCTLLSTVPHLLVHIAESLGMIKEVFVSVGSTYSSSSINSYHISIGQFTDTTTT